ncbi:hypothetical protein N0V93_001687 [Gnomoniopsis smithogilvyi]|uniref:Endoglucanase EG-II n=1 Tax=Gnomoniopsis smithogilvyi TaxID=1191159 RepID=A0A9W9D2F6_9PEZI|nr:hypothetical protein N0V93_001687 [Gnomoniopsis smithogilvyi]
MQSGSILVAASLAACVAAQVQFLGVAIAGGDFGCQIDGTCPTGSTQLPLGSTGGGGDGPGQMQHWTSLSKPLNLFRLPVSWQFLANNQVGGTLDSTNLGKYDQLVQACLQTGAYCMIDIHNFARVNNAIIGQGGPSDDEFVSLWTQLATKYATEEKMVFELMNEPHDLDINVWAATCQKVVTSIRNAGASSQMILLPGTNFDSAATLVSSGSTAAMMNITNPDGTTNNLLLDIHKYLDEDNSGTHTTCTTNNIDAFTTVAQFLRQTGRKGLISESGASSDATCVTNFCAQNTFINQNADVFMGFVGWGAGSFDTSYILSLTPSKQNNQLVDNQIMQQCMIDVWANTVSTASAGSAAPAAPATTATPAQSTVYITPVVTTTLGSSLTAVTETGATSTLDWSTVTAELGTSQGPLVTASKASTLARTTQKVNSNVTGTTGAADSLLTATGSQNLTSAATAVATAVPTGASSKALDQMPSLVLLMASIASLLFIF